MQVRKTDKNSIMTEDTEQAVLLRKIVVAVDTSAHSQAALKAAVTLAKILGADVRGVFVEDEMWNRISQIPSTNVINADTGNLLPFENDLLEDHIRILKKRLSQNLESISEESKIKHSLAFTRGKVEDKILEAAQTADLITIGLRGHSASRNRLGSSAKKIIQKADKPILVLKEGWHLGRELNVFYDGSPESRKGLDLALNIAEKNKTPLNVMLVDERAKTVEEQNREIKEILGDIAVPVETQVINRKDLGAVLNAVNKRSSGLLIIPKSHPLFTSSIGLFLNYLNCPVLMMS